ncbi:probable RNA-binding EIF1AD [Pelobates cultripes]|uniref:Probable RNA-binding protein EIF1AD n=1 Tax=Pelobates cultripes TaxID=61616 RepID=A0AAD1TE28_PELCU|nr:probable RNA-binding EIF1AD [Pelobates cultripes]
MAHSFIFVSLYCQVLGSPGNNLHEVQTSEGEKFLASMPTKFRKNIWIKRGDYLIVDPIAEGEKVRAEIAFILYKDHQRLLQKEGFWPSGFNEEKTELVNQPKQSHQKTEPKASEVEKGQTDESDTDSEDDSELFVNTNRVHYEDSDEETESDGEEN